MAGKRAAHRYAKALMSLAKENNQLDAIDADIRLIDNSLKGSKELRNLLKSPVVKNEQKLASLKAIFSEVSQVTTNLFDVLIQNKRIDILSEVTQAFIALVDEANHVVSAEVTTATELTPEMEEKVLAKVKELTGNKATLIKKVDAKLLGGFLLRIGDLQYDASISGKLNSLKQKFKQNAYN